MAALAGAVGAGQADASTTWSAPVQIDHQAHPGLRKIACPSAALCVAVDESGDVLTSTDPAGGAGAWTTSKIAASGFGTEAVACTSVSLCMVVGIEGLIYSTEPAGGASKWITTNGPHVGSGDAYDMISCAGPSLCLAADGFGGLESSTNPTGGESAWKLAARAGTESEFTSASCPSTTLCLVTHLPESYLLTSTNPGSGPWTELASPENGMNYVSCPTTKLCVATSFNGNTLVSTNPTDGAGTWTSDHLEAHELSGLNCANEAFCALIGEDGTVGTTEEPTIGGWRLTDADGNNFLSSVSCPSPSFCAAVDTQGNVIIGTPLKEESPTEEEHTSGGGGTGGGGSSSSSGSGGSTSPTNTPVATISSAQILSALDSQIVPAGKSARIGSLLKYGGLTMPFSALEAGTLVIQWWQVPKGAHVSRKAKPELVARGRLTFSVAGSGKIKIGLTSLGRRLLRHATRLTLTAKVSFAPVAAGSISATKAIVLKR